MELQDIDGQNVAGSTDNFRRLIHEQADNIDKGRYPLRQLGCTQGRYVARAGRVENEADGVGTGCHDGIDIFFNRENRWVGSRSVQSVSITT